MSRQTNALGVLLLGMLCQGLAQAEANDPPDTFSLRLSKALAPERFFVRAGVIGVKIKSKSGNTYDVTGPVVTRDELQALMNDGGAAIEKSILARDPVGGATQDGPRRGSPTVAKNIGGLLGGAGTVSVQLVVDQMIAEGLTGLGTPPGITATAQESVSTAGLSLGYYLSDDYSWVVEAYVLAKPPQASVYAAGPSTYIQKTQSTGDKLVELQPFGLQGQKIATANMLPPIVMLGKYWGGKDDKVRLFTGGMAMYAIFYNTKVTDVLNSYVGGTTPGGTTISFKNAFGMGPMVGAKLKLDDTWHVSFNVGSVKLKTVGTLTTRNSFFTNDTGAIQQFGRTVGEDKTANSVVNVLQTANEILDPVTGTSAGGSTLVRQEIAKLGGAVGVAMGAIAYNRGQCSATQCDLGTYVRKNEVTLQNTLFMLSVGRSF